MRRRGEEEEEAEEEEEGAEGGGGGKGKWMKERDSQARCARAISDILPLFPETATAGHGGEGGVAGRRAGDGEQGRT